MTTPHACGYCLAQVGDTLELLPTRTLVYEQARFSLALRLALEPGVKGLALLVARISALLEAKPDLKAAVLEERRSNGERGAGA